MGTLRVPTPGHRWGLWPSVSPTHPPIPLGGRCSWGPGPPARGLRPHRLVGLASLLAGGAEPAAMSEHGQQPLSPCCISLLPPVPTPHQLPCHKQLESVMALTMTVTPGGVGGRQGSEPLGDLSTLPRLALSWACSARDTRGHPRLEAEPFTLPDAFCETADPGRARRSQGDRPPATRPSLLWAPRPLRAAPQPCSGRPAALPSAGGCPSVNTSLLCFYFFPQMSRTPALFLDFSEGVFQS